MTVATNLSASAAAYPLFREPTEAYRGKPFWSWNGRLDKEEALRQIRVMKEMGFGGFFMHSRTGLSTEYLGEEWFEFINLCADEAERLGMEAWLYDEDRWPSGTAGGLVTENPAYRLKFMRLRVVPAAEYRRSDVAIAVFACRLDGLAYRELRRLDDGEKGSGAAPADGDHVLEFTIEEQVSDSFYNGYTYLDTMNAEAVGRFIELTHERYKAYSGSRFGKSIKGVFTDEPHRGALMDGFSLKNEDAHWLAPWTYTLFERFRERYGYDLVPRLPELFLQPEGRSVSQVKWHYTDLLQEMFQSSFLKPIDAWCRHNGLVLTGHTLHEDSLSAQTAMVGSMMRFYEHMGYPGVDVLTEGNDSYWVVKQLSSVARQLGQKWMMSELYGCTGWQMPLAAHKADGDWQALLGINLRCHHLAWYTMEGESKRDFPASISYQSAWWRDYERVETYFSRLGVVLSQGRPLCDLLVVHPVESVWCQVYPGWSRNLSGRSEPVQRLERQFRDTFEWLAGAMYDFDYGDEEMMSRLASVETDADGGALLRVGQAAYRAVLVSGLTTMRASTLSLLQAFIAAGGRVIVAGEVPAYVDALPSEAAERMAAAATRVPMERSPLVDAVRRAVPRYADARDATTGEPVEGLYAQVRQDGDERYVVLMSMNRHAWRRNVRIRIRPDAPGASAVEEWMCATGERRPVEAAMADGALTFVADFPPSGEHVYVVRPLSGEGAGGASGGDPAVGPSAGAARPMPVRRYADAASVELTGLYRYRLDEPNVCVLDRAAYRLAGEPAWSEPLEILKADRAIRDALGLPYRSGEMIQPWYREKYMEATLQRQTPLELAFDFAVEELPASPVRLAVERPDRLELELNGERLEAAGESDGWWIDPIFSTIELPERLLRQGVNRIVIRLPFHAGFDLEALYVLGGFGVDASGPLPALTKLPDRLQAGDITRQGLPFYGGTVTYAFDPADVEAALARLPADAGAGERRRIALAAFEAGTVRIRAGGRQELLPWAPYEADLEPGSDCGAAAAGPVEIDLVLTRRNTFGPLHQWPLHAPSYGPDNWVTEGDRFREAYVLLPSGLLEAPRLVLQQPIGEG